MRNISAIALILLGSVIILGPIVVGAFSRSSDRENIAEFYRRNGSGVALPDAMEPAGTGPYAWACWATGALMIAVGGLSSTRRVTPSDLRGPAGGIA